MTKVSSTMLSVGTLLRRAEVTGAEVRVLVEGCWLDGRVLGCDGLGAVLDDGNGQQALVRLEAVTAVTFSRAQIDGDAAEVDVDDPARGHAHGQREPIEAGPVTGPGSAPGSDPVSGPVWVPSQTRGGHESVTAGRY